jgi:hypothetical protein
MSGCLCCSVCRQRPCDGLIPRSRSPTDYIQDSSKTVEKKEILRTVSNTGIYCSSDKVGTVYLV